MMGESNFCACVRIIKHDISIKRGKGNYQYAQCSSLYVLMVIISRTLQMLPWLCKKMGCTVDLLNSLLNLKIGL